MANLYRIAVNSFRESVREPVYFLMLLGALLIIGHYPWMTLFVFREQLKLVVDGSMATTLFFSLAACVLCATTTVSREMRNGTVLLLLSKPLSRWSFVIGKILGIAAAAILFCLICCFASVIAVYVAVDQFRLDMKLCIFFAALTFLSCVAGMVMNFLKGSSFSEFSAYAAALLLGGMMGSCLIFGEEPAISLVDFGKALFLILPAVWIMAVIAVGFSTRFDVVPSMCMCCLIFFLGLLSSYLFGGDSSNPILSVVYQLLYAIIPNWQFFWMADALAVNNPIPSSYILWSLIYTAIYSLVAGTWAVVLFQNREAAGTREN
jgi:ABC-type transport system involved in multi-copper enzyme maturation permease subunit